MNGDAKVLPPGGIWLSPGKRPMEASCISVIDPVSEEPSVLQRIDIEGNEAAVSAAVVPFSKPGRGELPCCGHWKGHGPQPRQFTEGYIHVYRFHDDGRDLEFIHKTKVEDPPMALIPFQGRLLAAIGKGHQDLLILVPSNCSGSRRQRSLRS